MGHYERFTRGLEDEVQRSGWIVLAYCWMPNFRSSAAGRDMAAWLCRRWSGATLAELGSSLGLIGTDSVSKLVRRAEKRHKESANWRETARHIEDSLGLNTEHKA